MVNIKTKVPFGVYFGTLDTEPIESIINSLRKKKDKSNCAVIVKTDCYWNKEKTNIFNISFFINTPFIENKTKVKITTASIMRRIKKIFDDKELNKYKDLVNNIIVYHDFNNKNFLNRRFNVSIEFKNKQSASLHGVHNNTKTIAAFAALNKIKQIVIFIIEHFAKMETSEQIEAVQLYRTFTTSPQIIKLNNIINANNINNEIISNENNKQYRHLITFKRGSYTIDLLISNNIFSSPAYIADFTLHPRNIYFQSKVKTKINISLNDTNIKKNIGTYLNSYRVKQKIGEYDKENNASLTLMNFNDIIGDISSFLTDLLYSNLERQYNKVTKFPLQAGQKKIIKKAVYSSFTKLLISSSDNKYAFNKPNNINPNTTTIPL